MPKFDCPLQLSPVFKPRIWGRHDLGPLFTNARRRRTGNPAQADLRGSGSLERGPIGEVWLTDDTARFLNGSLAGLTLGEATKQYGPELLGACWKDRRFPVLAKYIYTSDWLSVQVHPDDGYARAHEPGCLGKCEMWYIVRAERRADVLLGLKKGVTREGLRTAFERGDLKEKLNRVHPQPGDAMFVPPGTVHALGPGLILFEAEQNSDLTYRLDDFGRLGLDGKPRPLHRRKGLEVTSFRLPAYRDLPRLEFREPFGSRRYVLACPFFAVEELTMRKTETFQSSPERVETLSVLEGEGRAETAAGWLAYRAGETWLVPPATGKYRWVPVRKTRLLKFYIPDLDKDFRQPLARRGVRSSKIARIVFS